LLRALASTVILSSKYHGLVCKGSDVDSGGDEAKLIMILIILILIIIMETKAPRRKVLPSFSSALQFRVSFGLLNNLPPFFCIPRLTVSILNNLVFMV
jgi:hypothetical protein